MSDSLVPRPPPFVFSVINKRKSSKKRHFFSSFFHFCVTILNANVRTKMEEAGRGGGGAENGGSNVAGLDL